MIAIPKLETDRLVLRPPLLSDFSAYAALMASPRSVYMGGPYKEAKAWALFSNDVAMWTLYGHGALFIDLKGTGRCVGQVAINHGPWFPEKELGWLLYDGHVGHGYATEAAAALRDWAFGELGLTTLVSYIDPSNVPSIAVAERLRGVRDPDAVAQDEGDLVFRYFPG